MMQRSAGRRGGIARLASSLLFQTTALAGSLSGLPVVFPVYSRAYASSCTPASASADITRDNVATTTVVCTVPSGTLTTPQYAYGGSFTVYGHKDGRLYKTEPSMRADNMFQVEIDTFLQSATTGKRCASDIDSVIPTQKILDGLYRSSKMGREVKL